MTGIDTSMYNQPQAADPIAEAVKAVQLRNAMNNVNSARGGMTGTQGALNQMGAGQAYGGAQPSYPTPEAE